MATLKSLLKKCFVLLGQALLAFVLLSVCLVFYYKFFSVPFTFLMLERSVTDQKFPVSKQWKSFDEISPSLPAAIIIAEDQKFKDHSGFDTQAIEKAIAYNAKHQGKKTRGASTISQQTAKNVFLWPGRSWIRKGLEVYFTFLIELFWSKKRILEVYMNVVEMGPGIYGAEAAAQYYFKKSAKALTAFEAASIAAILPNPRYWSPIKPSQHINKKRNWILRQMKTQNSQ